MNALTEACADATTWPDVAMLAIAAVVICLALYLFLR